MKVARFISIGGFLTALAVMLQSAPVFLPAVGLVISPLSTLPIAIAAVFNISLGTIVFLSSAFILIIINPQEAIIFFFTTGLLGVTIGALLYRKGIKVSIISSSMILLFGMFILTYIAGVPAFKELAVTLSLPSTLLIFFTFSLIYVSTWNICLRKFTNHLFKLKFLS